MKTCIKTTALILLSSVFALAFFLMAGCESSAVRTDPVDPTFDDVDVEVELGAGKQLSVDTSEDIEWMSVDETIAEVTDDGVVIGVSLGATQIFAFYSNENTCFNVTVIENTSGEKYGYTMWSDEFDGDSVNMDNWSFQTGTQDTYGSSTGPSSWGNSELQYYQKSNASVQDGQLIITAQKESESIGGKNYT
ncbi:MAG: Ig-like domain-containing protein, partial [Clostridia bacterium]|nr:Ig-like domain-containing protein [Clostridia bacterium]